MYAVAPAASRCSPPHAKYNDGNRSDCNLHIPLWQLLRAGLAAVLRGAPKFSLCFLLIAAICAIFAPLIAPYSPVETNPADILQPPSLFSKHVLGTDNQGRDLLSRLIYGAQTSVKVGVLAVLVAATVGTSIGLLRGVFRGWVDRILMRLTDMFLALPYLMMALTTVSLLGSSVTNVILVIGLLRWMGFARVLRGEVLKLVEMDFVRLALVADSSRPRIMIKHIFPNIMNTLLVLATLEIGLAVIVEASLCFLGLGIPRPMPSWARCSETRSITSTSPGGFPSSPASPLPCSSCPPTSRATGCGNALTPPGGSCNTFATSLAAILLGRSRRREKCFFLYSNFTRFVCVRLIRR